MTRQVQLASTAAVLLATVVFSASPGFSQSGIPPESYPTNSGGPYVATLELFRVTDAPLSGNNSAGNGMFRLSETSPNLGSIKGGWLRTSVQVNDPCACGLISDDTTKFLVKINLRSSWSGTNTFPPSLMDRIHIESRVILRPHADLTRATPPKVWPYPTTLSILYPTGPNPGDIVFEPFSNFEWIDQDVELELHVWLDGDVVGAASWAGPNNRYVYKLPVPLRSIKTKFSQLSPYLLPVAIIGDPPGDQSWSQYSVTQGIGAGVALYQGTSSSVTTQDSYGFGPISWTSPTYTTTRSSQKGVHQRINAERTKTLQTNGPFGPGNGDLMVALVRPSFAMYRGARDMDFRFLCAPGTPCWQIPPDCRSRTTVPSASSPARPPHVEFFPMKDLVIPPPGSFVANLTQSERDALRALNPLVGNPHAILSDPQNPSPRYYFIDSFSGSAGQVSAQQSVVEIHSTDVTDVIANSTTRDGSQSFAVPLGAITAAAGMPLPIPDLTIRQQETTTTTSEYKTVKDLSFAGGTLLSYNIGDSNPGKRLCVEVYFDTLFNAFVFRDCNPPPMELRISTLSNQLRIKDVPQTIWQATQADVQGKFIVTGSLGSAVPATGTVVNFLPLDKGRPRYHVTVASGTGNLIVPNMVPGRYQATLQGKTYTVTVSAQGQATMTAGTAPLGMPSTPPTLSLPGALSAQPLMSASQAVINEFSAKCLDVAGGSLNDGGNVQQFACHGGINQQWDMKSLGGTSYQLVNKNSGKCLDVAGGSMNDGGNVQQFACHTGPNQRWTMTPLAGGYSQFVNQNSGKCLDVAGGSKNDGANIQQFACHGGSSQRARSGSSAGHVQELISAARNRPATVLASMRNHGVTRTIGAPAPLIRNGES
jgi:hypothetical protein